MKERNMSRKLLFVFSTLIALSLLAAACGGGGGAAETVEVIKTVIVTVEVPVEGEAPPPEISEPVGYGTITQRVKDRGTLVCGSRTDLFGFGYLDENGRNMGFDIDLCRALAAAVLGDPEAVEFVPLTAADRGPALQTGEVDILSRNATWTTKRDSEWGNFTWIMFYDGQGFMAPVDSGITTLDDMDGATVCVTSGTTTEKNLAAAFGDAGLTYEAVIFEETAAVYGAYEEGRCDATTSDMSQLAAVQTGFQDPDAHALLGFTISKEPLTPAVPAGDDQWFDLVKTVMWALITAEEYGVTMDNADDMMSHENANVRTLLGAEADWGYSTLELDPAALANAIKAVGNYSEIYDRYFAADGLAFALDRGPNSLARDGGLIYAPPIK
jgi:general L-amino acid transport system substrate-binding protein